MVARIEHERAEREALEQQRMELLKRKQKLIADNKKRRDDLANLDKELEKFIDVSWLCCGHLAQRGNAMRMMMLTFCDHLQAAKPIQNLFDKNVAPSV